jgi:hypothetical protein
MADLGGITPVGLQAQAPDTFGTLNNILGIQGKRQQLAIQAQDLQQKQIETQTAQGASQFFSNFNPLDYVASDGTTDMDKVHASAGYKNASALARPAIDAKLQSITSGQIKNKSDLMTLGNQGLSTMGSAVGKLATDQDVLDGNEKGRTKVDQTLSDLETQFPGAKNQIDVMRAHVKQLQLDKRPDDLKKSVLQAQLQGLDAATQLGLTSPKLATTAAGAVNFHPLTGAITQPLGAETGSAINPTPTQVAQATTQAVGAVKNDQDTYEEIAKAGKGAPAIRGLANQVSNLADTVDTGYGTKTAAKYWQAAQAATGVQGDLNDSSVRRQVLGKLSAQLKTQAGQNAPNQTVANNIDAAFPSPDEMGSGAVGEAARYVDSRAALDQQRLNHAEAFKKTHKGNVTGMASTDSAFMSHGGDPYAARYNEMSPSEQRSFLETHYRGKDGKVDRAGVMRLMQNSNALKHSKSGDDAVLNGP